MWVLERPGFLLLFLILPAVYYIRHVRVFPGGRLVVPVSVYGGARFRPVATFRGALYRLSVVLYWMGLCVLIIALAGPARTTRERVYLSRGIDIVFVLDQSASMGAQDFQPGNRFESARDVIRRFVEQRPNDHIGLVGFSAEAALRVAPTVDDQHVLASLDAMELLELGDGTAIGMGIALAALHLTGSSADGRVIVLLTDGVNNAGEISPEAAAEVAGQSGIRIYAVGVGSGEEAPVEVTNPRTGETIRGTVREGYDQRTLEQIAELSGGGYFAAGSSGTLQAVFDAIGTAERVERRVRFEVQRDPQHRVLLIWALGLLVAELVIRRLLIGSFP